MSEKDNAIADQDHPDGNRDPVGNPTGSLADLAKAWHRLDRGAADYTWQRSRLSWAIHTEWQREDELRRDAGGKRVPLATYLKNHFDETARSTLLEDVVAMRVIVSAELQDAELPRRSRNAYYQLGRTMRRGLALAESVSAPAELDAKKEAVAEAVRDVATKVANGELATADAAKTAKGMIGAVLGEDLNDDDEDGVENAEPPEVRAEAGFGTKEFAKLVEDAYATDNYQAYTVCLVRISLQNWGKQAMVNALNSAKVQKVIAESTPDTGDIWIQIAQRKDDRKGEGK